LESSSRGELGDRQVAGLDRAVAQGEVMSVKALHFHGIDGERGGAEALPLEQAGGGPTDQIDAIAPSADTGECQQERRGEANFEDSREHQDSSPQLATAMPNRGSIEAPSLYSNAT
jgi:hypothetical protein